MDKQEIIFVIKPDGRVEEEVMGVSGPDCEKITESIEKALGKVSSREHKADFYQQPNESDAFTTTQA